MSEIQAFRAVIGENYSISLDAKTLGAFGIKRGDTISYTIRRADDPLGTPVIILAPASENQSSRKAKPPRGSQAFRHV